MEDARDKNDVEPIPHHEPTGKYSANEPVWLADSINSRDVIEQIQRRALKHLPLYPKILDELPTVKVFNVWSERYTVHKGSLGVFTILECEEGAEYSKPLEIPFILREASAYGINPNGGTDYQWFLHDGRDVANDIIGNNLIHSPSQNLMRWGVFVAKGETPTAAEMSDARAKLADSCGDLAREIQMWIEENSLINISDKHVKALNWLRRNGGRRTA